MNIYSIYKATNKINGKCYIGFDSNWPKRQNTHRRNYKKNNLKFYDAIKKYGWNNFEWQILYQSLDGIHCLNFMENYFINEHNSFHNGYNMTLGGEGVLGLSGEKSHWFGKKHTEESKLKMSIKNKGKTLGRKLSEKTKQKISHTMKNSKVFSEETKQKISNSKNKIYYYISPNETIVKIVGLKKFCFENSLSYDCMRQLIYGKAKQHKGWKYHSSVL